MLFYVGSRILTLDLIACINTKCRRVSLHTQAIHDKTTPWVIDDGGHEPFVRFRSVDPDSDAIEHVIGNLQRRGYIRTSLYNMSHDGLIFLYNELLFKNIDRSCTFYIIVEQVPLPQTCIIAHRDKLNFFIFE